MHNPQWVFIMYKSDKNRDMKDDSQDSQWVDRKYNKLTSIKIVTLLCEIKRSKTRFQFPENCYTFYKQKDSHTCIMS